MGNLKLFSHEYEFFDSFDLYKFSPEHNCDKSFYDFNLDEFNFDNPFNGLEISDKARKFSQQDWKCFFADLLIYNNKNPLLHREKVNLFKYFTYPQYRFPKPYIESIKYKIENNAKEISNNPIFLSTCAKWKTMSPEERAKKTSMLAEIIIQSDKENNQKIEIETFCDASKVAGNAKTKRSWFDRNYKLRINVHPSFLSDNSLGDVLDTIYHEFTHIKQIKKINNNSNTTEKLINYNRISALYIPFSELYSGYCYQPVEQDAFIAASMFKQAINRYSSGINPFEKTYNSGVEVKCDIDKTRKRHILKNIYNINKFPSIFITKILGNLQKTNF